MWSLSCPLDKGNKDLFNESKVSKNEKGFNLYKYHRGIHVVEADLAHYLSNGHLRAILDVVEMNLYPLTVIYGPHRTYIYLRIAQFPLTNTKRTQLIFSFKRHSHTRWRCIN